MSFIESLFGISPDGGSGACELLLVLVPLGAAALWTLARRLQARAEQS